MKTLGIVIYILFNMNVCQSQVVNDQYAAAYNYLTQHKCVIYDIINIDTATCDSARFYVSDSLYRLPLKGFAASNLTNKALRSELHKLKYPIRSASNKAETPYGTTLDSATCIVFFSPSISKPKNAGSVIIGEVLWLPKFTKERIQSLGKDERQASLWGSSALYLFNFDQNGHLIDAHQTSFRYR